MNVIIPTRFQSLVDIAFNMLPECQDESASKHFSFILRNSRVLAIGVNQPRTTHPLSARYGYRFDSIHAEMASIIRLRHKTDFTKCRIINIRLSGMSLQLNKPILRMSRPCSRCTELLAYSGFKACYYSTNNGFEKL